MLTTNNAARECLNRAIETACKYFPQRDVQGAVDSAYEAFMAEIRHDNGLRIQAMDTTFRVGFWRRFLEDDESTLTAFVNRNIYA